MLSESGRRDGRGGRSAKSVRHIHQTLHKAFDDAVSLRYLRTNPAVGAKPPLVATRSDSLRYWTPPSCGRSFVSTTTIATWAAGTFGQLVFGDLDGSGYEN